MSQCLFAYIYLSICLSFHCVSTYLSIAYRPIFPSINLSIYLSIDRSIYLSIYFTICHFFRLSIDLSFFLSSDLCIYVSIYLSAIYLWICLPNLFIHLSIYPSIYLSICLSIHFTLQTPHLTLGTKRPTLHFTFSILNTTSENHTLQTLQSTPCTLHPPVATLRTPDANSTFHMPTSALYTLQHHTHTQRKSARWHKVPNKYGKVGQG